MATTTLLKGHGLRHEGRYWNGASFVSGGMAPGYCTCGDRSEPLPSAAARKRWHREHKDQVRQATT